MSLDDVAMAALVESAKFVKTYGQVFLEAARVHAFSEAVDDGALELNTWLHEENARLEAMNEATREEGRRLQDAKDLLLIDCHGLQRAADRRDG